MNARLIWSLDSNLEVRKMFQSRIHHRKGSRGHMLPGWGRESDNKAICCAISFSFSHDIELLKFCFEIKTIKESMSF